MSRSIRPLLSGLAAAFTVYLAAGAMLWPEAPRHPIVFVGAFSFFLIIALLCVFVDSAEMGTVGPGTSRLPAWAAVLALAVAVGVPNVVWYAAGEGLRLEPVATRCLGAVGALMAIITVRGRPGYAWIGTAILTIVAFAWIGPDHALNRGLVGVFVWVGTAHLIVGLVHRARREAAELARIQRTASERIAAQEGARRARRRLMRRALVAAGPVLARAVQAEGRLDETERSEARIAEETLRDELRGSRLLDEAVREQLAAARRRGASVNVIDEGGLEDLDDARLADVRVELARVLSRTDTDRIWVRTSTHPQLVVTVVGRNRDASDDDAVWHEIPR